ncbi:MAG TPA: PEGA domain-containing protein [Methanoregula sp.]|nr:PEGA domain-containing protein [Methanoregula sp.]
MSHTDKIILCCLILTCCSPFIAVPVQAFTSNSLDLIIDKNGDAVATFHFTLEGFIENSIPQSVLEEEVTKGLTTSSEPPELLSMDRSSATLRMKKFADTYDVPAGTEYLTATMDFKKAEAALENSAISGFVSADFSPKTIVLTFPDSYKREFSDVDVLPAVSHTVIDPSKTPRTTIPPASLATPEVTALPASTGSMNVTASPRDVKVYLDAGYIGEAPSLFSGIAVGSHTVEFRKEGFESVRKNVTILGGKTTTVVVALRNIPPETTEETSSTSIFIWIGLIIALIAIAGAGYYLGPGKKKREELEEEDTGDDEDQESS